MPRKILATSMFAASLVVAPAHAGSPPTPGQTPRQTPRQYKQIEAFGMTWTGVFLPNVIENANRRDPDIEKHPEAVATVLKAFEPFIPQNEKAEAEQFIRMVQRNSTAPRSGSAETPHTSCDEDSLETVSDGGDTLVMQSGRVYKVDSVDTVDTQLWLRGDDVLICDDVMINKDEQGEKASVALLH